MYQLTALLMRGHWWCVGYMYIGSAADGVNIVLTILMTHTDSYSRVNVIRVNCALDVVIY